MSVTGSTGMLGPQEHKIKSLFEYCTAHLLVWITESTGVLGPQEIRIGILLQHWGALITGTHVRVTGNAGVLGEQKHMIQGSLDARGVSEVHRDQRGKLKVGISRFTGTHKDSLG